MSQPVFPDGIKEWVDKQDNIDDVFAGDTNGAYAEIIAIENFLVNDASVTAAPIGFPNRNDSTFSFNKSTRTFTIQPVGESFDIYYKIKKYTKTDPESVTIPNTTGLYFIYYTPEGVLSYSTTFPGLQNMIYVSYVYWNAAQTTASLQFDPGDERHGTVMDKATHERLHAVDWTQWVSGLQIYGYTLADGTSNDAVKVSITNGVVADEDLSHSIKHSASPSAFFEQVLQSFALLPVMYRDGANGDWKQDAATEYPFKNTASGRINYNQYYEGSWKQTQLGSGQFIAYYVCFTADIRQPIKVVQGQRTDNSLANAQANNDDRNIQWGSIPFQEFKVLYRLIYETNDTFTNDRKAALRDVLDLRAAKRSPGGGGVVPSAHSNLTGLDYASSGHVGFVGDTTFNAHLADYVRQPGYGTTAGSTNAYTLTLSPALVAYTAGVGVSVKIHAANTGASTINVNGLGAKSIIDSKGSALTSGKLRLNGVYTLRYDGTNFILQGEGGSGNAVASDLLSGKTASVDAGDITGTMPNMGTFNLSFGDSVPAGYYSGGTVPAGKKFASGGALVQSGPLSFVTSTGSTVALPFAEINGLSFTPSTIIVYSPAGVGCTIYNSQIYTDSGNKTCRIAFIKAGVFTPIKAISPAVIGTNNVLPSPIDGGGVFSWIAYE